VPRNDGMLPFSELPATRPFQGQAQREERMILEVIDFRAKRGF